MAYKDDEDIDVLFLDLSHRQLIEIPSSTYHERIQSLCLNDNQLTSLPVELFDRLYSLTWLDLRSNKLTELRAEVGTLTDLRTLLLDDNELTELPAELGFCRSLVGLHLSGNPLMDPSVEVRRKGCVEILRYLRKKLPEEPNFEDAGDARDRAVRNRLSPSCSITNEFDIWSTPSRVKTSRSAVRPPSQGTQRAFESNSRRLAAQRSSAFLSADNGIKLRTSVFPTAGDIRAKTTSLKQQKAERMRKVAIQKELERQRKIEKDEQWKLITRKKQLDKIRKFESGELQTPPVNPPFARLGDVQPFKPTRPSLEPPISGLFTTSNLHTNQEINAIRRKVQNLVEEILNSRSQPTQNLGDPGELLDRAQKTITELQQISRSMHY